MASFLVEVKFSRFWPKTMDYNNQNRGHFLRSFYSTVEGVMKLNMRHSVPLEMPFHMYAFSQKSNFSVFGQKPWTIITEIEVIFLRSFYSTVEGVMKLKCASFCSS